MTIPNDNAYVIWSFLEYDRGPINFGIGALKNNPAAIRRLVEIFVAKLNWTTTIVDGGEEYTVDDDADDVVILAGSDAAGTIITLPAITDGRVLVFKDKDFNSIVNPILLKVSDMATETIDSASTTFEINASGAAIVFVAESSASKWYTIIVSI